MAKKKKSTTLSQAPVIINKELRVSSENIKPYLLEILKRYNGYNYISISAAGAVYKNPERAHIVLITVHQVCPMYVGNGLYQCIKDIALEAIAISDLTFKGVIFNKQGDCVFGNPFKPYTADQLTISLGDESATNAYQASEEVAEIQDYVVEAETDKTYIEEIASDIVDQLEVELTDKATDDALGVSK